VGYCSEVALAVSKKLMPHFLGVLAKEPAARPLIFKEHDHLDLDYNGEGTLLVIWHEIKWYDSCAEINALNDFIELCEAEMVDGFDGESSEHVRFVRLGEDSDDYVEKGTLHDWDISMSRSLMY